MAELILTGKAKKPKAPRTVFHNESDVKDEIKRVLGSFGDKCYWLMPESRGMGTNEKHDFHVILNGVGGTIEAKFGDNTMSEGQERCRTKVLNARGFSFQIDEKNVHGLENALRLRCRL